MSRQTRRTFIKVSGALIGGIAAGAGTVTAAESTDRFIVQKRGNRSLEGLDVVFDLDQIGFAVVRASESELENARGVKSFAPDLELSFAEPVAEQLDESATDEPFYPLQWDKEALDVPTAHETTRGEGTRVAVIDTGVAAGHPDLQHAVNVGLSQNFTGDPYDAGIPAGGYHGTHVAGIVAADDQNEEGVVGNAPATEIIDCRVFAAGEGGASFASILAAILYATELDCDAANLSLGAYPIPRQELGSFYGKVLNSTMTYANKEGTLLVISAGNDSADLQHDKNFISLPNEGAQAVSVSATGPIGFNWGDAGLESPPESPAFYTNYGTNAITIGAPGGDADPDAINVIPGWHFDLVLSTIAEPVFDDDGNYLGATYGYGWAAGTSMAAPQVAGAAALVKSANPNYNANQVESALTRAADVPDGYGKEFYGSGFLNIVDAL